MTDWKQIRVKYFDKIIPRVYSIFYDTPSKYLSISVQELDGSPNHIDYRGITQVVLYIHYDHITRASYYTQWSWLHMITIHITIRNGKAIIKGV